MKGIGRKILAALACGVVLLTGFAGCSDAHDSPEAVAEMYIQSVFQGNGERIGKLMPDNLLRGVAQVYDISDAYDELGENAQQSLQKIVERFGARWKYSYDILDVSANSASYLDVVNDVYGEYGVTVEEYCSVEANITVEGNGISDSANCFVFVMKTNNQWYLAIQSPSDLLSGFIS